MRVLRVFQVLAAVTVLALLSAPAGAAFIPHVAQVDFRDSGSVTGWNPVGTNTSNLQLLDPEGNPTPTYLTMTNPWGWTHNSQGPSGTTLTHANVNFPADVVRSLAADNLASGRDGLAKIRLNSDAPYLYELTFASIAYPDNSRDTRVNLGGTWNFTSREFDGGETVILTTYENADPAVHTGFLSAWSTWDEGDQAYVLDLQVGNPHSATSGIAGLNALHINAVPEPGTWLLLLSSVACGLLMRRRR